MLQHVSLRGITSVCLTCHVTLATRVSRCVSCRIITVLSDTNASIFTVTDGDDVTRVSTIKFYATGSSETPVRICNLHAITAQKTAILISKTDITSKSTS